jgi:hypothetical protein
LVKPDNRKGESEVIDNHPVELVKPDNRKGESEVIDNHPAE